MRVSAALRMFASSTKALGARERFSPPRSLRCPIGAVVAGVDVDRRARERQRGGERHERPGDHLNSRISEISTDSFPGGSFVIHTR
jgi:hypothetical protein